MFYDLSIEFGSIGVIPIVIALPLPHISQRLGTRVELRCCVLWEPISDVHLCGSKKSTPYRQGKGLKVNRVAHGPFTGRSCPKSRLSSAHSPSSAPTASVNVSSTSHNVNTQLQRDPKSHIDAGDGCLRIEYRLSMSLKLVRDAVLDEKKQQI